MSQFIENKDNSWKNLLENLKKRPDLLGLQHILEQLENFVRFTNEQNYPPTNIEKLDDNNIIISLALAGFQKSQINISLNNNELIVKGIKDKEEKNFITKGIAFRNFEKKFFIGYEGKILKATYFNGLLQIYIHLPAPIISSKNENINIQDE